MEELHKIIQSLSKDEKREFKLNASIYKNSKESNHIKLFDFLEKMKTYDTKGLQKKVQEQAFGKQFSITKQKLWDSLLDSLSRSDKDITIRRQISKDIEQVDILLEHACFKLARRKILHALKNAIAIDHHVSVMKLCHQYQFVISDSFLKNEPYEHAYAYQVPYESTIKHQYHLHFAYANLLLREIVLQSKYDAREGSKLDHLEKIRKEYLEVEVPEKYSTLQVKYTRFMAYNLLNHYDPARYTIMESGREMAEEFHKNPLHLKENIKGYISVLFVLVNGYMEARDWKNFRQYMTRLRKAVMDEPTIHDHYFIILQCLRLQSNYYLGKMDEFDTIYKESTDYLKEHPIEDFNYINYSFHILVTKLFFGAGNYKKALEICNDLRNSMSKETFETNATIYVLFLLIHLSLGNYDVVAHYIDYYKKHLEKWNYMEETDKILIRFFQEAINDAQPKIIKSNFRKTWEELQKYSDTAKFNQYFDCLDFKKWLKS